MRTAFHKKSRLVHLNYLFCSVNASPHRVKHIFVRSLLAGEVYMRYIYIYICVFYIHFCNATNPIPLYPEVYEDEFDRASPRTHNQCPNIPNMLKRAVFTTLKCRLATTVMFNSDRHICLLYLQSSKSSNSVIKTEKHSRF